MYVSISIYYILRSYHERDTGVASAAPNYSYKQTVAV